MAISVNLCQITQFSNNFKHLNFYANHRTNFSHFLKMAATETIASRLDCLYRVDDLNYKKLFERKSTRRFYFIEISVILLNIKKPVRTNERDCIK